VTVLPIRTHGRVPGHVVPEKNVFLFNRLQSSDSYAFHIIFLVLQPSGLTHVFTYVLRSSCFDLQIFSAISIRHSGSVDVFQTIFEQILVCTVEFIMRI